MRARTFLLNADGQIVEKAIGDKTQDYYYVNGRALGTSGGFTQANFNYLYEPISDATAAAPGIYTVQAGDTLAGIALAVYGDASLWYVIADANGITGDSELTLGLTLTIPANVTSVLNGSESFAPYDPGAIIGDTTPTLPQPARQCNAVATIVMIVVMVVVVWLCQEYLIPEVMEAFMGVGAATGSEGAFVASYYGGLFTSYAATGALANSAGQLAAMAVDPDRKFDGEQVWASALGMGLGGVAAGLVDMSGVTGIIKGMLAGAVNATSSQAGSLLAGTQEEFNWAGVAAAAIMSPINSTIDTAFGVPETTSFNIGGQNFSQSVSQAGMEFSWAMLAPRIASELTKSFSRQMLTVAFAQDGEVDFEQVLADGFGNAVANSIVDQMKYDQTEEWVEAANDAWAESEFAKWDQDRSLIESDSRAREAFNAWDEQMAGLPWRTGVGAGGMGAPFNPSALIGPVNQMQPLPETTPELWASPAPGIFDRFGEVADDPNLPPIEKLRRYGQLISVPSQFEAERVNAAVEWQAIASGAGKTLGNLGAFALENVAGGFSGAPVRLPRWELTPEEQYGAAGVEFLSWIGGIGTVGRAERAAGVANSGVSWNPLTGPGPLGEKVASTFRGASYTELSTTETTTLYRVWGGSAKEIGPYWTRTPPAGPLQSTIDSALSPAWGNTATNVTRIDVPAGVRIYEGFAAPQGSLVGGGNQVFMPKVDPAWIVK